MRIRAHLLVLIVAALLPVLAFAAIMTARFWELQRDAFEQRFLERVRALRLAADTEIENTIQTLRALGAATDEEPAPYDDLRRQFEKFVATESGWATIGIVDPDGKPIAAVLRKGTANLAVDPETLATVRRTLEPAMSNLVASSDPAGWTTYIAVPVVRDNAVRYVLYAGVDHRSWLAFLQTYPIAARATLTLNDRNGLIIARTLNHERWVGRKSGPGFWNRVEAAKEDSFRSIGLEGQSFYSAFSRSPISGWVVGTGVPQEDVEAELRGSLLVTLGGIAATVLLAGLLALFIGRRITSEVDYLSVRARSMADDRDADAPPKLLPKLTIAEAQTVLERLDESSKVLHERQASLNVALANEAQARAIAERQNEAKDQFLAMLGHELRNPLSAISSASAIQSHTSDPALLARSRDVIERQVRHLTGIVNGLLDVARIASGKVVLAKAAVNLADITRDAVYAIQDSGRADHVKIALHLQPALVWGDDTRLAQVVTNLVDNAVKYTPQNGQIEVRVDAEPEWTVLTVADSGSGISQEVMPRIFDLFAQGERTRDRAQGGLGLGLTVVRALVGQHGGTVTAASDGPGKGARFVVRLPRLAGSIPAAPAAEASATGDVVPCDIVVVDDNVDARTTLADQLRAGGHRVATAVDGPDGVSAILARLPDLAIVDIGLPGFDGLEVARRVRKSQAADGVRLIALSGYGSAQDRAAALGAGFSAYWVKPFDEGALRVALAAMPARSERMTGNLSRIAAGPGADH